nr:YdaU family protein [uncultured Achromobacter sp.]
MNYYPHHIGDFNSATRHLTRTERSVYRDLIELYYDTEAALSSDFDKLCRLVLARSDEERTAVEQVLNEFFTKSEQGWSHSRCDSEIAKYHGNKEAKSAAGKASAAKRAQKAQQPSNETPTDAQQPLNGCATNQEPITNNQEPDKELPPSPRKRGNGFDASGIDLPDWLDREDWQGWVADRKARKKPVTQEAAKLQLKQLADFRAEGHQPGAVIANRIASGYQGLYPPRTQTRTKPNGATAHGHFNQQDYHAGVAADGTF